MSNDPLYSFQLARGLLKALALFQSDDETRVALACTNFEIRESAGGHHELTLVAVDGRRLASYQTEILKETLWGEIPATDQIVVDLKGCNKLPKVAPVDVVTCEVFAERVEFVAGKLRYTTQRIDKIDGGPQFPPWRDVIPSKAPEQVDQLAVNHELLADFGKAARLIVGEKGYALALRTYGAGAAISVQFPSHREFFGIIMPLKSEHPEAFPAWLAEEKKRAPKAPKITKADMQAATEKVAENPAVQSAVKTFVDGVKASGVSVTIAAGGKSVTIACEEHIEAATKLAFKLGYLTRAALLRELGVSYTTAGEICHELARRNVVSEQRDGGRYDLIAANPATETAADKPAA